MKSTIRTIALLLATPLASFAINTYNVFTDATGAIQFFEPNGTTKFGGGYTFEIGTLSSLSTVLGTAAQVQTNFKTLGFSGPWDPNLIDTNIGGASISLDFDGAYPAGIAAGQQIAMWGYDSKAVVAGNDWVVLTNPSWLVSALVTGASVESRDYTITDPGTVAVFGSMAGVKVISTAVPEPSTYAALAGLAVLGAVAYRRRRSA